jgi:RNA 2',3'-cyclic 3'-phosphodiesterase
MRLFLALPLAEPVATELARLTERLRASAPDLRWSAPESWHITLQFLGAATPDQYDCLIPRLAALRSAPVPVHLAGLGVFERAGVLHLGVEPAPGLLALQQRIVAATTPCGFEPEARPYHPHITLVRRKGQGSSHGLRALSAKIKTPDKGAGPDRFTRFTAREFLLYESHLSSSGSTYEVRYRFSLTRAG